jgi:hypothetical protein
MIISIVPIRKADQYLHLAYSPLFTKRSRVGSCRSYRHRRRCGRNSARSRCAGWYSRSSGCACLAWCFECVDRHQIVGSTGCRWRGTGFQKRAGLQRDRELQAVRRVRADVQIKCGRLGAMADQDPLSSCNSRGKTFDRDRTAD